MDNNQNDIKKFQFDFVNISYTPSTKLLEVDYNSKIRIELEHAMEMVDQIRLMTGEDVVVTLVTASNGFVSMDTDAKNFIASSQREHKYTIASAFVTTILANRIAARFFIKFSKPPQPCKIFKNKEEALNWLFWFNN